MGAEYLSYVKSIATFAPTFYGYIISVLASVRRKQFFTETESKYIHTSELYPQSIDRKQKQTMFIGSSQITTVHVIKGYIVVLVDSM